MHPGLEPAALPADAIEVGRIADAWGLKGFFKVIPYSASPEALFSSKRWYLQTPEARAGMPHPREHAVQGTQLLRIRSAKQHGDGIVARADGFDDRDHADLLRGARVFIPRSSFPSTVTDEFYWVDLMGLTVCNREGVLLGAVKDLLSTGPQTVLVVELETTGEAVDSAKKTETLIPFVAAYVDSVSLENKQIVVDWQLDY